MGNHLHRRRSNRRAIVSLFAASLLLAACSGGTSTSASDGTALPVGAGPPTEKPSQLATAALQEVETPAATVGPQLSQGQMRLVPAPEGNEVRYKVREQLADVDFPSDAVGSTTEIAGMLVIDERGAISTSDSKFVVDLTTLRSDRDRRDRYIQDRTLETGRYPTAEFAPRAVEGLPDPLPGQGQLSFQVTGDMTIHGVTQSLTWDVDAQVVDGALVGSASTSFPFSTFGLQIPRVMMVLSVEDNIRLEYAFNLVPES
jgi:polyisoprenoid-binding protein YceI